MKRVSLRIQGIEEWSGVARGMTRESDDISAISSSGPASAGIGTSFIAERLPWLHRASPSTTLDKIIFCFIFWFYTMSMKKYGLEKNMGYNDSLSCRICLWQFLLTFFVDINEHNKHKGSKLDHGGSCRFSYSVPRGTTDLVINASSPLIIGMSRKISWRKYSADSSFRGCRSIYVS